MFLHSPDTVIGCAAHIVATHRRFTQQGCQRSDDSTCGPVEMDGVRILTGHHDTDTCLLQYYEYFSETEALLDDYVQGQALHRLDAGVDVQRFLTDDSYKEDTVLGLCMTTEKDILQLAIDLARKYNVSLWLVHMTQLQHLFGSEVSTQQLKEDIKERKVIDTLIEKPQDFLRTMEDKVLTLIDGVDHDRLVFYYTLISSCQSPPDKDQPAHEGRSHIKVLEELRTISPKLNYHCFLRPQTDLLEQIGKYGILFYCKYI